MFKRFELNLKSITAVDSEQESENTNNWYFWCFIWQNAE